MSTNEDAVSIVSRSLVFINGIKLGKLSKAKKKYMCVYCHMSKKSRVGRSGLIFFFFLLLSTKPEIVVPGSGI
jgi:predicted SnoaL-like aldol condensation-catalyzing enzyme